MTTSLHHTYDGCYRRLHHSTHNRTRVMGATADSTTDTQQNACNGCYRRLHHSAHNRTRVMGATADSTTAHTTERV